MNKAEKYIHGYHREEQDRLYQQARQHQEIVFDGIDMSPIQRLLEVGGGVGAQSEIILRRFPQLHLTSIDRSETQVATARQHLARLVDFKGRYDLRQMDATAMNFADQEEFDGAFVCWMLEHAPDPLKVLEEVHAVLTPGGKVFITEVMNHTLFIEPRLPNLMRYWEKYNQLQRELGGDPAVGAKLGGLLHRSGYSNITVHLKPFYLDRREPEKKAAMFEYWEELLLSGAPNLLNAGYVDEKLILGLKDEIHGAKNNVDSIFFYSFVLAQATA